MAESRDERGRGRVGGHGRGRGRGGERGRGRGADRGSHRGTDRGSHRGSSSDRGSPRGRISDRGRGFSTDSGRGRGSDRGRPRGTSADRGRGSVRGRGRGRGGAHHAQGSHHAAPLPQRSPSVEQELEATASTSASPPPSVSCPPPPEPDAPIFERTSLTLASNPLPPLSTLSATLSKFTNLHKLDLSYMQPGEADAGDEADNTRGIESLRFLSDAHNMAVKERKKARKGKAKDTEDDGERGVLGETLTLLNLSGNTSIGAAASSSSSATRTFEGLDALRSLFVLNLASCALRVTPPKSTLLNLESLRALILSHNRLTSDTLKELPYLPNLNTIVLSHNEITALPRTFPANLPNITKISISHNDLGRDAGADGADNDSDSDSDDEDDDQAGAGTPTVLPDFTSNIHLREIRMSHNKSLKSLPLHIATWGKGHGEAADGRGLFMLDAGHCDLSWDNVQEVLSKGTSSLRGLKNLTLAGNVRVEEAHHEGDEDDDSDADEGKRSGSSHAYKQLVQDALPGLSVLDGTKLEKRSKAERSPAESKKRKRAGGDDDEQNARRLASRAGPAPDDDEDAAAVVDSDDEGGEKRKKKSKKAGKGGPKPDFTPRVEASDGDGSTPSKPRRAKRGQKNINRLITGSLGHVEQDGEEGGEEKKATEEKKDSKAKSTPDGKKDKKAEKKKEKKSRPATAWDETPAPAAPTEDTSATTPAPAPTTKAQTSIAGIIEVKKRKRGDEKKEERGAVDDGESGNKKKKSLLEQEQPSESIGAATSSAWGGGDDLGGGSGSAWG